MYIFAYACLLVALLAALGCGGLALLRLWEGSDSHTMPVEKGHWLITLCLLFASAMLLHALFWQDYRLEYVASYTDAYLPLFYRLTAFWAGQPGSMLFWALMAAISGTLFAITKGRAWLSGQTRLWFWAFFYANMAFFCVVLACWSNPFLMVEPVPVDGNGLNPLLQNPGMIFHPPLLFMGYAGLTVPACLALAQILNPDPEDQAWFRLTRPFINISWLFLTAGIVLGAWWAYMELGWGGYWAWDPVENASLVPWLLATAALHIIAVTSRGGKLKRSAAALMALAVTGAFFGTYLTRSGVIQSVHAFGDGGVGTPLLVFTAASLCIILFTAFSARSGETSLASLFSREGALVVTAWMFIALTLIIALATIWPVITAIAGSPSQGLEASFYNRVCLPLGAALLLLLCCCAWLGWNGGLAKNHGAAMLCATSCAFVAAACAIWWLGYHRPLPLVCASAAVAIVVAMCFHLFTGGLRGSGRMISAIGAHTGLALMAFGIAFSGPYTEDRELLLAKGQREDIGPYTVALQDVGLGAGPGYDYLRATLKITRGWEEIGVLAPERRMYEKFGSMQFSEVDVLSSLREDIYASLLGMDEEQHVLVKMSLEPMVNWIWIGGVAICVLPLLGLGGVRAMPRKKRQA